MAEKRFSRNRNVLVFFSILLILSFVQDVSAENHNRLLVATNQYDAYLGNDSTGGFVEINFMDTVLKFRPVNMKFKKGDRRLPVFSVENIGERKIKYNRIFGNGIDAEYEFLADRIKERIIVQKKNNLPETSHLDDTLNIDFTFNYSEEIVPSLDGKTEWNGSTVTTNRTIHFIRRKKPHTIYLVNEFYRILQPFAVDSRESRINLTYTLYESGGETHLTLNIPYGWLRKAKYPVEIDPTIEFDTGDAVEWENWYDCSTVTDDCTEIDYTPEYGGSYGTGFRIPYNCDTHGSNPVVKLLFQFDINELHDYKGTLSTATIQTNGQCHHNEGLLSTEAVWLMEISPFNSPTCSDNPDDNLIAFVRKLMDDDYCLDSRTTTSITTNLDNALSNGQTKIAFKLDLNTLHYEGHDDHTIAYEIDEGDLEIHYEFSCSSSSDCLENEYCDSSGICKVKLANGQSCAGAEIGENNDLACQSGNCAFDNFDGSGYFCAEANECVHDGSRYGKGYRLCNGNDWYKTCQVGSVWSEQVNCAFSCSNGLGCDNCFDGIKNQDETDIDCGGTLCDPCPDGKSCLVNSDCLSNFCNGGVCASKTCIGSCDVEGELSCAGASGDIWRCEIGSDGCLHKVLYQECDDLTEYCDDSGPSCRPLTVDYSLSVEDAVENTQVFKQPGDYVTIVFDSPSPQTVGYTFEFECVDGPCSGGTASLSAGVTKCKFLIDENASAGEYVFSTGEKQVTVEVIKETNTIFVTDRTALFERFDQNPKVHQVLNQIYSNAQKQNGVVYYLDDYFNSSDRPWRDYDEYNEDPLNPSLSVNIYALQAALFTAEKCGDCKNVVIVGDDFVVPHYRVDYNMFSGWWFWKSLELNNLLTDSPYIPNEKKSFGDESIFSGDKEVAFIVPDNIDPQLQREIEDLKQTLVEEYHDVNYFLTDPSMIDVINSSDVACNSYELGAYTLVVIGNRSTNNAIKCLPWFAEFEDTISVERNVWGVDKYAIILNGENPYLVRALSRFISNGQFKVTGTSTVAAITTNLETVEIIGIIPGIDTAGDLASVANDCGHYADSLLKRYNDNGKGAWCAFDVAMVFVPIVSSSQIKAVKKVANIGEGTTKIGSKVVARYGDDVAQFVGSLPPSKQKAFQEFLESHGDEIFERSGKNFRKFKSISKGYMSLMKKKPFAENPELILKILNDVDATGIDGSRRLERIADVIDFGKPKSVDRVFEEVANNQGTIAKYTGRINEVDKAEETVEHLMLKSKILGKAGYGIPDGLEVVGKKLKVIESKYWSKETFQSLRDTINRVEGLKESNPDDYKDALKYLLDGNAKELNKILEANGLIKHTTGLIQAGKHGKTADAIAKAENLENTGEIILKIPKNTEEGYDEVTDFVVDYYNEHASKVDGFSKLTKEIIDSIEYGSLG